MTENAKATPFVFVERKSQTRRTIQVVKNLAEKNPSLRPYLVLEITANGEDALVLGGVYCLGAVGSMNYVSGTCSRCGRKVGLGKWRVEILALWKGKAPVAFQFGERFCSERCGTDFGRDFLRHGLKFQPLSREPEKCLLTLELNAAQNHRLN